MVNGIGECDRERANASQLYRSSKLIVVLIIVYCRYQITRLHYSNNYYLYQLLILCHIPTDNSRFHYSVLKEVYLNFMLIVLVKNDVKRHVWTVFNNYYTLYTPPPT